MDDNNDKFTGDEFSEEDDSGYDSFVGDELDENTPGDGEITGDELNEEDDSGYDSFVGDELDENTSGDGEIIGDDDSGKKSHAHVSPEMVLSPPISPEKSRKKKAIQKWVWGMGALIMVFLMGVGGFFFIQHKGHDRIVNQDFLTVKVAIPPKREIWLKDFLIPLRPEHLYTCVSFSVVIRSWDKAFLQRQSHEKQWIRGLLYDILLEKIQMEEETPSLDKFKEWMQAVKYELPASQIDTVDIHNFLVL